MSGDVVLGRWKSPVSAIWAVANQKSRRLRVDRRISVGVCIYPINTANTVVMNLSTFLLMKKLICYTLDWFMLKLDRSNQSMEG